MIIHTISRETGEARQWDTGRTFFAFFTCNAFDTSGAWEGEVFVCVWEDVVKIGKVTAMLKGKLGLHLGV